MSRRKRGGLSPTLFPFLAVLVCTLGTLILFLALVAQKAKQTATAELETAEAPQSVKSLIAEREWMRDRFLEMRERQSEELRERSTKLAHLEDQLRKLRTDLEQLQQVTVRTISDDVDLEAKRARIADLEQAVAAESEALEAARQQAPSRKPRVVIVPHQGPHGTDQRPLYLECTAEGIRMQPEGSMIAALHLEGPAATDNPLEAALRAARYHYRKTDPEGPETYPLLLVRPDGIETYARAMVAMQNWEDQFGYELVPAEVELAFPKSDSRLKQQVEVAIREAVTRQHARLAAASYVRSRSRAGSGPRVLSAVDLARRGTGGGRRYASRPRSTPSGASRAMSNAQVRDFDDALEATAAEPTRSGDRLGEEGLGGGLGGEGLGGSMGFGSDRDGFDVRDQSAEPTEFASRGAAGGRGPAAASARQPHSPYDAEARAAGSREPSAHRGSAGEVAEGEAAEGEAAAGEGPAGQGAFVEQGRVDGESQRGTSSTVNIAGATGGNQASSLSGEMGQEQATPPPANSSAGSLAAESRGEGKNGEPQQQLRRGGSGWALPGGARQGGTTIVRGVSVRCTRDAFELLPEQAGGAVQRFAIRDGFVERAAMELATAVHDRVEGWGYAIAGGRWQPVLRVAIESGAEMRYRQLRTLLQNSGLELEPRAAR